MLTSLYSELSKSWSHMEPTVSRTQGHISKSYLKAMNAGAEGAQKWEGLEGLSVVAFELGLEGCVGAHQVERMWINQARVLGKQLMIVSGSLGVNVLAERDSRAKFRGPHQGM